MWKRLVRFRWFSRVADGENMWPRLEQPRKKWVRTTDDGRASRRFARGVFNFARIDGDVGTEKADKVQRLAETAKRQAGSGDQRN